MLRPHRPHEEEIDPDKPITEPNRRDLRRAKKNQPGKPAGESIRQVLARGPSGRARRRTGKSAWFVEMQNEQNRKLQLQKVLMHQLEPAVGEIALKLEKAGYRTVWDMVSVTDINRFLVHGMRSFELRKLHQYLARNNVPTKWDV